MASDSSSIEIIDGQAEVMEAGVVADTSADGVADEESAALQRNRSKQSRASKDSMATAQSKGSLVEVKAQPTGVGEEQEATEVKAERVVEIEGGDAETTIGEIGDAEIATGCALLNKWWFWLALLLTVGVVTGIAFACRSGGDGSSEQAPLDSTSATFPLAGGEELVVDDAMELASGGEAVAQAEPETGASGPAVAQIADAQAASNGEQVVIEEEGAGQGEVQQAAGVGGAVAQIADVPSSRAYLNLLIQKGTSSKLDHSIIPQGGYWAFVTDMTALLGLMLVMVVLCCCCCCKDDKGKGKKGNGK